MPTSSESAVLEKIRQAPYYSLRIRPASSAIELSLADARELVKKNSVQLRGWDFPHYDSSVVNAQHYIFNLVDWERHVELWRFYKSGQFIYFGETWDTAMDLQPQLRRQFDMSIIPSRQAERESVVGVLGLIGMIYSCTEFFLFTARLASSLGIASVNLDLGLHNVERYALVPGDMGVPWHGFYQSRIDDIHIERHDDGDLVLDPLAASRAALREIFECFNWDNAEGAIKSWQEKFMTGRFAF